MDDEETQVEELAEEFRRIYEEEVAAARAAKPEAESEEAPLEVHARAHRLTEAISEGSPLSLPLRAQSFGLEDEADIRRLRELMGEVTNTARMAPPERAPNPADYKVIASRALRRASAGYLRLKAWPAELVAGLDGLWHRFSEGVRRTLYTAQSSTARLRGRRVRPYPTPAPPHAHPALGHLWNVLQNGPYRESEALWGLVDSLDAQDEIVLLPEGRYSCLPVWCFTTFEGGLVLELGGTRLYNRRLSEVLAQDSKSMGRDERWTAILEAMLEVHHGFRVQYGR